MVYGTESAAADEAGHHESVQEILSGGHRRHSLLRKRHPRDGVLQVLSEDGEVIHGMQSFNQNEPVKAIIAALNEARVPIAAIDNVFELVKADIKNHTVPYNPSLDSAKDLATSATTDKATEPNG